VKVDKPYFAYLLAFQSDDPSVIEPVMSVLMNDLDAGAAREVARLIEGENQARARRAAIERLKRHASTMQAAIDVLGPIATESQHAALESALVDVQALVNMLSSIRTGLEQRTYTLAQALTDLSLAPSLPSAARVAALTEGIVGAFALCNGEQNSALATALDNFRHLTRLVLLLALPTVEGDVDLGVHSLAYQCYVALPFAAKCATGAIGLRPERYAVDSRAFIATMLRFRASQLEIRSKLGRSS
jgi:hypothetical protein